jgi:hypothetical protein
MLFVKHVVHLIHYYKKKNVYQYFYVIIVVHVILFLVSKPVFKPKLENVRQHVRKQHKIILSFFFLGYLFLFLFCCLGFDQYTFYLNKSIKHADKFKDKQISSLYSDLQMNKYLKFCSCLISLNGKNRTILSSFQRFQHTS